MGLKLHGPGNQETGPSSDFKLQPGLGSGRVTSQEACKCLCRIVGLLDLTWFPAHILWLYYETSGVKDFLRKEINF